MFGFAPYKLNRLLSSFNPDIDPEGSGWVAAQRERALTSSNFIGKSDYDLYFDENLSNLPDLEANQSLTYLIINYGWIVAILITTIVVLLSIRLVYNMKNIKDVYGKYMILAISTLFASQSLFSILINLNLWFSLDIPLPFISYGGMNQIINITLLCIVLSVYRRKDILLSPSSHIEHETNPLLSSTMNKGKFQRIFHILTEDFKKEM